MIAVDDDYCRWGRRGSRVQVGGEIVEEVSFGTVAVKADGKGLGELEGPLWERAGVERVEVGDRRGVRVGVGGDEGVIGGVG